MRMAVLSDTHFGDEMGLLVRSPSDGHTEAGPGYEPLRRVLRGVDVLVLLGDILDFSVAGYEIAYRDAKAFFTRLRADGCAPQLVYVPGNHDFDIWHTVEHQVNVINRLERGQLPRSFKRAVPGVIDDRPGRGRGRGELLLPDVAARPEWHEDGQPYGSLFLDSLTRSRTAGRRGPSSSGPKLSFSFAYPNLYLVTDEGRSVLLTHGHYLEAYWTFGSEWASCLAGDDLGLEGEGLSLDAMVGINLPLSQLACSGIGQAHPLTSLARAVQQEAGAGRTERLARYLDRLEALLRSDTRRPRSQRIVHGWVLRWLKRRLLRAVATVETSRYSADFTRRPSVRQRFRSFYRQSLRELRRLEESHGVRIPEPTDVVFGHTHQPIPWGSQELIDVVDGRTIRLANTGGWVRNPAGGFSGADVLLYESGRGIWSESIREADLVPAAPRASVA